MLSDSETLAQCNNSKLIQMAFNPLPHNPDFDKESF